MVFYGLTLDVGQATREHMRSRGFRIIEKVVCEDDATPVHSYFVTRNVAKKEALEACDFKYRTNYGSVGFNRTDIFDAIYGNENAVLAMTSENIEFLHHINTGYGDAVPIIGAYISDKAKKELVEKHTQMTEAERASRLKMGGTAAKIILENRQLFDDILLYDGEDSCFNMAAIGKQLDTFIEKAAEKQKRFLDVSYVEAPYQGNENFVFLSYSHKDRATAHELLAFLQFNGVRVWYDAGIPAGDNWMNMIADKMSRASAVVLLSSERAVASEHVQAEVRTALRFNKKLIKINLDEAQFDPGIEMYLYSLNQLYYNVISYENKNSMLNSLARLGVKKPVAAKNSEEGDTQ
ncbi:MAG: toll/interleukin-1 receptor domain-containing protein [Clostridia bacterium]|nr:toll/interleukin-1 receptor domain-containing protein [Clostridia bacterium]